MTSAIADITEPIPTVPSDPGYPTSVLLTPIFVDGSDRRRRLIVRGRYLTAAACLAYLVMLGVSVTASPVRQLGIGTRPAPAVPTTASHRPAQTEARAAPKAVPRVEIPTTTVLADGDAAQDAPLVLRLALPATPRFAVVKPPITTRPTLTSRPHHDNDSPQATHPPTISPTPVASSKAASPSLTSKRAGQ